MILFSEIHKFSYLFNCNLLDTHNDVFIFSTPILSYFMYKFVCVCLKKLYPVTSISPIILKRILFFSPLNIMLLEVSGRQHLCYGIILFYFIFPLVAIKRFKLIAASTKIIIQFYYLNC